MKIRRDYLILTICFIGIFYIFFRSNEIRNAVVDAISICENKIIPSLFPTICIATLMINSGLIFTINSKIMLFFIFLVSQITGYPVGVKLLDCAVKIGFIDKKYAKKIVSSMICGGPAFIVSFVGGVIFQNEKLGIRLFISIFFANLILFTFKGGFYFKPNKIYIKTELKSTFLSSIISSAKSVFQICVLFTFFYTFLKALSILFDDKINTILALLFEVTDCVLLSNNMYISCFALSWCGICIHLQLLSFAHNIPINYFNIAVNRLFCAITSCLLLKLSMLLFPLSTEVFSSNLGDIKYAFGGNADFVTVFFLSIFVLLISLYKKIKIIAQM